MKDFDIAKYLREHQLGSYGILNHYVDLKPLKEGGYGYYTDSGDEKYFIPSAIDNIVTGIVGYKNRESNDAKNLQKQINDILKGPDSESLKQLKNKLSDYGENVVAYNRAGNDPHGADQVPAPREEDVDTIVGLLKQLGLKDKNIKENKLKLTGNGEGDEFEQAETVSEEDSMGANRIMDIGGKSIENAIFRLKNSGFDAEDVENLFAMLMSHHFGNEDDIEDEEIEEASTVSEEDGDPKEDLMHTVQALKDMGYTSEEIRDLLRDLLYPDYSDESID